MSGELRSAGLRLVLCSRPDCVYAGTRASSSVAGEAGEGRSRVAYWWCLAPRVTLDRRNIAGLVCEEYRDRGADRLPGVDEAQLRQGRENQVPKHLTRGRG